MMMLAEITGIPPLANHMNFFGEGLYLKGWLVGQGAPVLWPVAQSNGYTPGCGS